MRIIVTACESLSTCSKLEAIWFPGSGENRGIRHIQIRKTSNRKRPRTSGRIAIFEAPDTCQPARLYHEGGFDALSPRRRGRPRKMATSLPPKPTDAGSPDERSREELLKENEYLRAEVAYLKKLDALLEAKIVAYQMDRRPSFELVNSMLKKALAKLPRKAQTERTESRAIQNSVLGRLAFIRPTSWGRFNVRASAIFLPVGSALGADPSSDRCASPFRAMT